MNDLEFLDHCEQLCAHPDASGQVEFPADIRARFEQLAKRHTKFGTSRRIKVWIRLKTIDSIRAGIARSVRAKLRNERP